MIKLYLFGAFRLFVNNKPVDNFRSDKARALLAYLALNHTRPIARTTLASLLWDGYQTDSALANLRMTLSNLRQVLAPYQLIEANRHTIKLRRDPTDFWCDVLAADRAISLAKGEEFFAGGERIDSAPFQHWLQEQRSYYQVQPIHQRYLHPSERAFTKTTPNNLRRLLTPLIGRSKEFEILLTLLSQEDHPLITLVGEGGVGKTRLALALAQASVELPDQDLPDLPYFPDGVWFVPLAGIVRGESLPTHLAATIGEAMHYRFNGPESLTEQLCQYLHTKRALLILDNFEGLTEGADWLITLLQRTPAVKLLVTSRHRLNLEAEYAFRLDGLVTPNEKDLLALSQSALLTYSSMQLFIHRAERTTRDFQLTAENLPDVARICRFVGGLPLGIVLASTLLENHNCAQIVGLLQENYTILAATFGDLPPRQRSIQAVLDVSWQLLDQAERDVLAHCAIFRGSFSTEAALAVTEGAPAIFARLEAQSLLRVPSPERYELHELVRHYAATQLRLSPTSELQAHNRHSAYYLQLVQREGEQLRQSAQAQYRISEELENIRTAWIWAVHHLHIDSLIATLPALTHFYGLTGLQQEAVTSLAETTAWLRERLESATTTRPLQRLFAALLLEEAYFQLNLAQPTQAVSLVAEAQRRLPALADPQLDVNAQLRQGDIAWAQGDYERHREAYNASLALARVHGWQQLIAHSLTNLGMNHDVQGEYAAAITNYQAALAIAQQIDHRQQINIIYNNLGVSHELLGDFSAALHYYRQTLESSRELADQEGVGMAELNLGIVLTKLGDWQSAEASLHQALAIFRRRGQQRLEAKTLSRLALLHCNAGAHQQIHSYAQQALQLARRGNFQTLEAETLSIIGHMHLQQGHHAQAIDSYRSALGYGLHFNQTTHLLLTQAGLALALCRQQDLQGAQQMVEKILPALITQPRVATHSFAFCAGYHVLSVLRDPRAEAILERGYQVVQQQAAIITDPELRTMFLTNVPTNRRLVELRHSQKVGDGRHQPVVNGVAVAGLL